MSVLCDINQVAVLCSFSISNDDSSVRDVGKPKVPLDQEWAAMAKKLLRGADPEEKLTWKTPEVRVHPYDIY